MSPRGRRRLRRGVVVLPSAFTIGNLFLGIWAVINASRGEFRTAGWLIVLAAFADLFDGRIARFTATGSEFGEELDSLVDAISFGVAPALIMYFLFLNTGGWNWLIAFIYIVAAIVRLARFNIEQAGTAKASFHGLPSPTAGVTLATYYAFTETAIFRQYLAHVNVSQAAVWIIIVVAVLMVSNVPYPVVPRFSLRTPSGWFAVLLAVSSLVAAFTVPALFFFPFALLYISYGLLRSVLLGFHDRLPDRDPLLDEEEEEEEPRELEYEEIQIRPHLRRRPSSHREQQE